MVSESKINGVATADRSDQAEAKKNEQLTWRVFSNTLSNYAGKIVTLGVGFFLTPFLVHQLGPATYGLWILVGSVVAYGALLDLGIAAAITKYIAEHRARSEPEQAQALVSTAVTLYVALGALVIVLSVILAPVFPLIFNVSPAQQSEAFWLVLLSGVAVGIAIPCTTSSAILRGLHRFDLTNLLGVIGTVLSLAATVLILLLGGSVVLVVAANIVVTLLMQLPAIWLIRQVAPELKLNLRGVSRALVRRVMSFSSALFVVNLAGQVQGKTDEIVIGLFLPLVQVTPYALSRRLSDIARILTDQFLKVLLPLASQLHAEKDKARLRSLYVTSTRLTLAGFVPLGLVLSILAAPLLGAWVGSTYTQYAPLVMILVMAGLIDMSQWAASHVLQGMERHHPLAVISIGSALANLVLSLILVQTWGLIGVAIGTLIPTTIECLFFVMPYTMRVTGVNARQALREIFLPGLLPAIPAAAVLAWLRQQIQPSTWSELGLVAIIGLGIYVAVYITFGASGVERRAYIQIGQSMFQRVRTRWA